MSQSGAAPTARSASQVSTGPSLRVREALLRHAVEAPRQAYLAHDPLRLCRDYPDPRDRETAALVAALLAFGKVAAFLPRLEALLGRLGPHPRRYVEEFHPRRDARFFSTFRLRLWGGDDLRCLLANLKLLFTEFSTLEEAFLSEGSPAPRARAGGAMVARGSPVTGNGRDGARGEDDAGLSPAQRAARHRRRLEGLARLLHRAPSRPWTGRPSPPPYYRNLVVDPSGGSACKRWNLFLRWVVREEDGVDLGLWTRVLPADLVVPLDVHVGRISGLIGLRRRRTLDWKAAEEVTRALAAIDPGDPLRFDLSLSHLGISEGCRGRYLPAVCEGCGIRRLCSIYAAKRATRQPPTHSRRPAASRNPPPASRQPPASSLPRGDTE